VDVFSTEGGAQRVTLELMLTVETENARWAGALEMN
jgi:hypothetical protein